MNRYCLCCLFFFGGGTIWKYKRNKCQKILKTLAGNFSCFANNIPSLSLSLSLSLPLSLSLFPSLSLSLFPSPSLSFIHCRMSERPLENKCLIKNVVDQAKELITDRK